MPTHAPVRVGIIGVHPDRGWASTAHVPALRDLPQFSLSVVSHHRIETARASAEKFGFQRAVSSTEELVNHPDVDLVVVTVRVPEHLRVVTAALEAGKSVFSEWRDAETMHSLAAEKRVSTMVGLQTRANPTIRQMRELTRRGYLGEVLSCSIIGSGITWGVTETLAVLSPTESRMTDDREKVEAETGLFAMLSSLACPQAASRQRRAPHQPYS